MSNEEYLNAVIKRNYEITAESWKLQKKWLQNLPKTDSDWSRLADDIRNFPKKWDNCDFAVNIASSILDDIERTEKCLRKFWRS